MVSLPTATAAEAMSDAEFLPVPPLLEAGEVFDGYKVLRQLHSNHGSHIYLVEDVQGDQTAALQTPSIDICDDAGHPSCFMMEDWGARRISRAHVMKAAPRERAGSYRYIVFEYIAGQTLAQWMIEHPRCELETMRGIVELIAKGLRAFHRREMLHRDQGPENIVIDNAGTV